jgi:uncharacterized DUF497 family protein
VDVAYDPAKNERNIRERGLDFERAREFDFETAVYKLVERNGELRWTALGYLDDVLHMLCFLPQPTGIRVISFRIAGRKERAFYEREKQAEP